MKIGIIDTGCTMTVAGKPWYQAFKSSVSFKTNEGRQDKTSIIFVGDSKNFFSRRNVKIPAIIGDLNYFLSVEIVPVNISLLISINFLSLMNNQLNFSTNTSEFKKWLTCFTGKIVHWTYWD